MCNGMHVRFVFLLYEQMTNTKLILKAGSGAWHVQPLAIFPLNDATEWLPG